MGSLCLGQLHQCKSPADMLYVDNVDMKGIGCVAHMDALCFCAQVVQRQSGEVQGKARSKTPSLSSMLCWKTQMKVFVSQTIS